MKVLTGLALITMSLAAASLAYYYGHVLPQSRASADAFERGQKDRSQIFEMNRRCQEDGEKFYRRFYADAVDRQLYLWDNPEYHYSRRLNTCLVYIRYINELSHGLSLHYNEVYNVYSNHPVLYGRFRRDTSQKPAKEETMDPLDDTPNHTSEGFFKEKEKLFQE